MSLPAGKWAGPKAWLFVLVLLGVISAVLVVLHRVNPDVIAGRSRIHEGTKGSISHAQEQQGDRMPWHLACD